MKAVPLMFLLFSLTQAADESCVDETTPEVWPATGCGIEDLQGIVIGDTKYLVSRVCSATGTVCSRREKFWTQDSCGRWKVKWYASSGGGTFPASMGLVPSCLMPATAAIRDADGTVSTGSFFAVNDRTRVGFGRR